MKFFSRNRSISACFWTSVVKTARFHCRRHRLNPWLGTKIPHAAEHGQKGGVAAGSLGWTQLASFGHSLPLNCDTEAALRAEHSSCGHSRTSTGKKAKSGRVRGKETQSPMAHGKPSWCLLLSFLLHEKNKASPPSDWVTEVEAKSNFYHTWFMYCLSNT